MPNENKPAQIPAHFVSHGECLQELKGKFLIKGKRLNKLDAAFSNNSTIEEDTVSEEDEAAEQENGQKAKAKVCQVIISHLEKYLRCVQG